MNFGIPMLAETFSSLGGFVLLVFILLAIVAFVLGVMVIRFVGMWFQAFVSGAPISLFNIIGISMRKIPPRIIVNARITTYKAGLKQITVSDLETHYLAGGNLINVVRAMIASDKANFPLTWRQATAIDLAGRDLLEAVKTSVNPKVIDCPDAKHGDSILAVAKDGVQLKCRARVTVRTNLLQLVGGATEETIIARVGEGIVNAIGASETHTDVLESPQRISKLVLERGLDAQTAFEILSIDIADITIGENIGARLRADKAESDKRIAQAKAEERRAMAVAMETEMQAKLVEAEAQIPMSIAEAFRKGHIGVMDYYKLKNVQADTQMRKSLGKDEEEERR
ncbi:MAG: flotillin-like protein FloA [Chlamydiota bacterium]